MKHINKGVILSICIILGIVIVLVARIFFSQIFFSVSSAHSSLANGVIYDDLDKFKKDKSDILLALKGCPLGNFLLRKKRGFLSS